VFCKKAKDVLEHYVGECERTKTWFRDLRRILIDVKERFLRDYVGKEEGQRRGDKE